MSLSLNTSQSTHDEIQIEEDDTIAAMKRLSQHFEGGNNNSTMSIESRNSLSSMITVVGARYVEPISVSPSKTTTTDCIDFFVKAKKH